MVDFFVIAAMIVTSCCFLFVYSIPQKSVLFK